jgi:hypothetical protein
LLVGVSRVSFENANAFIFHFEKVPKSNYYFQEEEDLVYSKLLEFEEALLMHEELRVSLAI